MRAITVLFMVALLVGCAPQVPSEKPPSSGSYEDPEVFNPDKEISFKKFKSEEELKSFVKNNQGGGYGIVRNAFMLEEAMVSDAMPSQGSKAVDFSETNVQVQGIDEADILKTDGEYIYTITGNTVFVIRAYPGEDAEVVSKIEFDSRPQGLFLNGNHLAVFGNFQNLEYFKKIDFRPRYGMTYFNIYDISNEDPELVKEYKFEGNYFQARMIGDQVYFFVTSPPEYRALPMPVILEGDVERTVPLSDVYYYDLPYNNMQFATVHSIEIDDPDDGINSKTVAIEGSMNMYMSHENIYITNTEYVNEWELRQDILVEILDPQLIDADRQLIEKIKAADNDVLSQAEKRNKILQIYQSYQQFMEYDEQEKLQDEIEKRLKEVLQSYDSLEYTVIHKIGVDDGDIDVRSSGQVPGSIVNQFSMDEYEDVLRIATTVNPRWWSVPIPLTDNENSIERRRTESTNNIYTLDENLVILDELEDLAEGERIFSTRFMGEKLYMVTFRQVDPFFVIDLSDPRNIEQLGELKIPGFSRYLHPYDEDTIIGIGRDASETGRQRGIKVSLFDVSDVRNPEEVANFVAEERYSQTTAEWEHKAFLFSKEKELLVIPAYSYDYSRYDEKGYNGAMVFRITKDDIEIRGIVDHSSDERRYGPQVERSLYIEDLLYTKSPNLLRINEISDLSKVKNVELTSSDGPYEIY